VWGIRAARTRPGPPPYPNARYRMP
jgi:hypothetical protein